MTAKRAQHRNNWSVVDGVLFLDKPSGITSNAALQKARRLLNAAKAGHTGTLDPLASGLLPLTFGEATKFSQMLLDADKTYEATVRLGIETDSGDAEGEVLTTMPVAVSRDDIERVLRRFAGRIEQMPPMYSALKRDGRPLYEYARAGIEVERQAREVTIHRIGMLEDDLGADSFRFHVECSKGTYIRTLAVDIGRALGCGAHLSGLRRTAIEPFSIGNAVALSVLEKMDREECLAALSPVDALVGHLPLVELDATQTAAIRQGRVVTLSRQGNGLVRVYGPQCFLGLGEHDLTGRLSAKRLVSSEKQPDFAACD